MSTDLDIAEAVQSAGTDLPDAAKARIAATLRLQLEPGSSGNRGPGPTHRSRRWLMPVVGGAAAAALIAGVVIANHDNGPGRKITPATTDSTPTVTSPIPTTSADAAYEPNVSIDDLRGHRWVLIGMNGAFPAPFSVLPEIEFLSANAIDPLIRGYDGCNSFGLNGTLDGYTLHVTGGSSSARPCVDLPVAQPGDGDGVRLTTDHNRLEIVNGGSARLVYGRLDSLPTATTDSLSGAWSTDGGQLLQFDGDSQGTFGTCGFSWSVDQQLTTTAWPDVITACGLNPDEATSVIETMLAQGQADAYVGGAELYLASAYPGRVVRLTRSASGPPVSPSTTAAPDPNLPQGLADWPDDIAPVSVAELPTLLPDQPIPGAIRATRTEASGDATTSTFRRYGQTWYDAQRAARLEITTTLGPLFPSDASHRQDLDTTGWPSPWATAYLGTPKMPGVTLLILGAPEGSVRLYSIGFSEQETIDVAKSLRRRPLAQAGWDATVPAGLLTIAEGGNAPPSWRGVQWSDDNHSLVAQLDINSDYAEAMTTGWYQSTAVDTIELSGTTAIVAVDGDLVAINWEINPRVHATFGYRGDRSTAEAIVRSIRPVDLATWEATTEPSDPNDDGCRSMFC